jgi:cytochrome P450
VPATFGDSELWDPVTRRDPHAFYARVREAGQPVPQVDPAGDRFWVVARHADVLEGLHQPAIGHEVDRHRPGAPPSRQALNEVDRIYSS